MTLTRHLILLILVPVMIMTCAGPIKETTEMDDALKFHMDILTVDTHADTPLRIVHDGFDPAVDNSARNFRSKVDFPRMKRGGLDAVFFAIFLGQGERSPEGYQRAWDKMMMYWTVVDSIIKTHPDKVELALNSKDAARIAATGKHAIYLGLENGYPIGKDINNVQRLYDLGIRYITLCHVDNNDLCDSSTDSTEWGGLSPFGKEVVAEMNRLGMMIDISHTSDETVRDILELSSTAPIASHSCAMAIHEHKRNLSDDLLKAIGEKGGSVQMNFLSGYVKDMPSYPERDSAKAALNERWKPLEPLNAEQQDRKWDEMDDLDERFPPRMASVSDAVDHIEHMVNVAGIDHVGIGSDFDGGGGLSDCLDASQFPAVTAELLRRGYSKEDITKIWGLNLLRVFREVEKHASSARDS